MRREKVALQFIAICLTISISRAFVFNTNRTKSSLTNAPKSWLKYIEKFLHVSLRKWTSSPTPGCHTSRILRDRVKHCLRWGWKNCPYRYKRAIKLCKPKRGMHFTRFLKDIKSFAKVFWKTSIKVMQFTVKGEKPSKRPIQDIYFFHQYSNNKRLDKTMFKIRLSNLLRLNITFVSMKIFFMDLQKCFLGKVSVHMRHEYTRKQLENRGKKVTSFVLCGTYSNANIYTSTNSADIILSTAVRFVKIQVSLFYSVIDANIIKTLMISNEAKANSSFVIYFHEHKHTYILLR